VVPTLLILDANTATKQLVILFLCGLSLSKVQFPHIVRVSKFRSFTLSVATIYFVALTWLSAQYPEGPTWLRPILVVAPLYIVGLSIWKTWFASEK
jgi:phosphatidylserine synthase